MSSGSATYTSLPPPPDPIYTLRPHSGEVADLKYVNVSRGSLVIGTTSGHLGLWDLTTKRETWSEHCSDAVVSVNTLPTTNNVLSQCRNSVVDTWDLDKQTKVSSLNIGKAGFCKLAITQTSNEDGVFLPSNFSTQCYVVAHPDYGKINIYDSGSQKLISTLSAEAPATKGMCMCVAMHCDSTSSVAYVFGGFEDGSILLWDCRQTQKELTSLKLYSEPVMCMAVDSQRESLVVGSATKSVEKVSFSLCEHQEAMLVKKYSVEIKNAGVASVAVRDDGKIFSTGGWDGRIRVFGWKKGKPLAVLNYHTGTVNTCAFAPSQAPPTHSNNLLCGSKDERISIWKLY